MVKIKEKNKRSETLKLKFVMYNEGKSSIQAIQVDSHSEIKRAKHYFMWHEKF